MAKDTVMFSRDTLMRMARFENPPCVPMSFGINRACWNHYDNEALHDLMDAHPLLFPFHDRTKPLPPISPSNRAGVPWRDDWGCVWETADDGITGTVTGHPLADWEAFEGLQPPDPDKVNGLGPIDWKEVRQGLEGLKKQGRLVTGGLRHNHTFLQLTDIRGYENLLMDMAMEEPRLDKLIRMVADFNLALLQHYREIGSEWYSIGEDLGMQQGPMLSPDHFRKYIKPVYQEMMGLVKQDGAIVYTHSDGDIRLLIDDILDSGADVLNLQDLVNGLDWIEENLKGRVAISLDLDRQKVTRFGTPKEIDALIREEVTRLGSKEGGFMLCFGLYPGTPLENAAAIMDGMEKYAGHFAG